MKLRGEGGDFAGCKLDKSNFSQNKAVTGAGSVLRYKHLVHFSEDEFPKNTRVFRNVGV